MGSLEPRILVENGMRQFRIMQERLQQVIDGNGVFRGDLVNEGLKIARGLQTLVKEWRQLQKEAREAAEQMDKEEQVAVMVDWFKQLPSNQQRDLLQRLTQEYNGSKTA
jgi:hypothetical protein